MSPFPLAGCLPGLYRGNPLDETVFADSDDVISQWEDEGGATTNLYQSVDDDVTPDSDWVELRSVNHIVTSGTRALRFGTQNPSGTPQANQTVELQVRCRWVDVFGSANPDAGDPNLTISMYESTTNRGSGSAQTITTSFVNYSFFPSTSQIISVGNWDNLRVNMSFECSGIDLDEEVDIEVSRVKVIFSP